MQIKYMVLCKKTGYTKYEHESPDSARTEAERLAILHPGDTFVILKQIAQVKVNNLQWDFAESDKDDDLPF